MGEGKGRGGRGGWKRIGKSLRRQSWRWERECVGQGKLEKGKGENEEWWSEKIRRVVGRKKEDLDEYRKMKRMVKRMVREAKKRMNEEWTLIKVENFKENKKIFWKRINKVRKGETVSLSSMETR